MKKFKGKISSSGTSSTTDSIAFLSSENYIALSRIVKAHQYAEKEFDTRISNHADWVLIQLLLQNDAEGKGTVVKHVLETANCSQGTVRMMFNRFEEYGYIEPKQKIGRSELYRPTKKLKKFISKWTQENFLDKK